MTGIEQIAKERQEQIEKHNRTVERDVIENNHFQLSEAAGLLTAIDMGDFLVDTSRECCPIGWDEVLWDKMFNKTYEERLVIAGALMAAEIDRLQEIERKAHNKMKRFKLVKLKFDSNEVPKYFGWETLPPVKSEHLLISESNFNEELDHWEKLRVELDVINNEQHNQIEGHIKANLGEFDSASVDFRYNTALKEGIDVTNIVEVRRYQVIDSFRLPYPKFLIVYNDQN